MENQKVLELNAELRAENEKIKNLEMENMSLRIVKLENELAVTKAAAHLQLASQTKQANPQQPSTSSI